MAEFVAIFLLWHFNASLVWWIAFILVFILQVAGNSTIDKKQVAVGALIGEFANLDDQR